MLHGPAAVNHRARLSRLRHGALGAICENAGVRNSELSAAMPSLPVFSLVLAAGASSRFGSSKQLARYRGATLVARACRLAETVCRGRTLLVTGAEHHAVIQSARLNTGFFVVNPRYAEGMATSIGAGVRTVGDIAGGALILLADQPLITAKHLRQILDGFARAPERIFASRYAGVAGPPVLFPAACFAELMELRGDQGARVLLSRHAGSVSMIDFEDAACDVDRPDDLAGLP